MTLNLLGSQQSAALWLVPTAVLPASRSGQSLERTKVRFTKFMGAQRRDNLDRGSPQSKYLSRFRR